ncbi:EF-hand domain-containing protein [Niveispirillum sp. KHB5.9]|uniref:EF-hand domain-containing protein n=1 Tax=Niveispirillum sp. KHB5.9 TaxID=3400269 RepID=UPI003A849B78
MTISHRTIAAMAVSALLAGATTVIAQPAPPADAPKGGPRAEMLAKYDANKDGKLDETEKAAIKADHFKKLDKDGDGKVKRADFPAAAEAAREAAKQERELALFDKMDTNKDGTVTQAEFAAFKPERGDHPGRGHRHDRKAGDK